ncbi:hypothetical protein [Vitiosangium sp. GDMCC 1.1324]|uniref:hypothetical protein n=1 Tax=Vitiosangium sp. (strain GDMCC 1.1324) TaxID=2138576 RepID=UPI000D369442|nr:hypothetical protein [Vitiosangium sp. GDMCC 1.1324]PTL85035.1 hypothetical protein DAT35_08325 [Vitiosangium sp. GDMCC 1.1324]
MTPLLVLLVLTQAPPEKGTGPQGTEPVEPWVHVQLEQGFEQYEEDGRLFLNTRLGADFKASQRVWLRTDISRVEKFGKSGFGTSLLADIRVGETLRLLPGVSLGDADVLAVATAGVGALYSGLDLWPGFVLTGWLSLYAFADSRAVATTLGLMQYYKRFWLQYDLRYMQVLNARASGFSSSLNLGARFTEPVRFELSVGASGGYDAYLAPYIAPDTRVELRGINANAHLRLWVLRHAGIQTSVWTGTQWWKSGAHAFTWQGMSVGLWMEQ